MKSAASIAVENAVPPERAGAARFALAVPRDARGRLALAWLWLAVAALVGAGLFSILLVLARAPFVKDALPLAGLFRVALVVHVDLSVLVWFAAVGGMLWTFNSTPRLLALGWAGVGSAAAGALVMAAAPFLTDAPPVMSNYVPVLDGRLFLGGLVLFALGCAAVVARSMIAVPKVGVRPDGAGALRFGLNASLVSAAVAIVAFAWSYAALPSGIDARAFYEVLFWGGGHVLQFTWTLLMFVAWLWLAEAAGARVPLTPRIVILLFAVGLASVFATPVIYLAYDIVSLEHYRLQTWLMRVGGGLAIVPFALALAVGLARARPADPAARLARSALWASLALFGIGGLIGLAIHRTDVRVPAHYHGAIVGVTLAFMGLVYHLLPRFGCAAVSARLARWQVRLYAAGQLAYVAGLAWAGGYGVQRKVAGAEQVLRGAEQVAAMGLMGLGGLAAIAGGLLFLALVLRALLGRRRPEEG